MMMMMMELSIRAVFVDTSVVCNLLAIPGRCQARKRIQSEFQRLVDRDVRMVLPIAAIIETGNHIAHIKLPNAEDQDLKV